MKPPTDNQKLSRLILKCLFSVTVPLFFLEIAATAQTFDNSVWQKKQPIGMVIQGLVLIGNDSGRPVYFRLFFEDPSGTNAQSHAATLNNGEHKETLARFLVISSENAADRDKFTEGTLDNVRLEPDHRYKIVFDSKWHVTE
jgi:hypothetical protein